MRHIHPYITMLALAGTAAHAQQAPDAFRLGQITITAPRPQPGTFGDSVVGQEEMWRFDAATLDQTVRLVPGVTSTLDTNGRRNERDIFVRGFGRLQVPLSIDGVRIYLPADNRLDFNRFLTLDLAQVQIAKGYVSVIDGPGALGGAINLVTRKPTESFEMQAQGQALMGRSGSYEGWGGALSLGSRLDRFYVQGGASRLERDYWELSRDFVPVTALEDGGRREGSDNRDWRVNLKAGFAPNATDEYTLNYIRQEGAKGAPLNVDNNPPIPQNSYWRWPWWNVENLYWISQTALGGPGGYLKTRLYLNRFDNALDAFDDASYTSQSLARSFRSYYDDEGRGGSIEMGAALLPRSDSRLAVHYRHDEHREYNDNRPTSPLANTEPVQTSREETWSFAAENTLHFDDEIDLIVGISYDRNEILQAQDYNAMQGLFDYPTGGSDAWNGQASVQWRYDPAAALSFSFSSRSRFPTNFERFSTRFGTALPNPDLGPERGNNLELAWRGQFGGDTRAAAALFYADVEDMIQTVIVATTPSQVTQTQNVGNGEYYGAELSGDLAAGDHWRLGGNYTYLRRRIRDALQPGLEPIGTPTHQALLFATWTPAPRFSLTPSMEYASDRWSDVPGSTAYIRTGEYTILNLQAEFAATAGARIAMGGRNLMDENYALSSGLPEPGRSFYAKVDFIFP